MLTNPDLTELLNLFKKYNVRYLVVGGYAVMKYTEPRFTKDVDFLISVDTQNSVSVYKALKEFGAPLENLSPVDFSAKGYFYQMGRAPLRVDIMMSIQGVDFEDAWKNREEVEINGISIPFIAKNDLIRAKETSGRPQDLIDAEKLRNSD